ncbi:hypothetical protein KPL71_008766 [Citrus sinensis]|uniref:Uncharacterized protein n=1 Tax=Citrus sinensis TaxID=2711 RepID=A0ACB8M8H3_CITSI|nr:hypothetical protein KPL71_008766 [Citrus sinensis]
MDTEELIHKCQAITIREEDKAKITLEVNLEKKKELMMAGCLVGKVMLAKGVNKEGLKAALHVGNNIFMFKFAEEADKKRVLKGGPWHFDRALIVLAEPRGIGEVAKQSFTHTSFWVQIHNVPLACMDKDFLRELGEKLGSVEEVQTDDNGDCIGEYARIRVSINITLPLERILFLKREGETDIPMPVVYERLPDFCYCCGIIGHQYKECGKYQDQPREDLPYGSWMKAITVGGFTKRNQNKGRWNYGAGKSNEKSASSENHSFQQQKEQNKENPIEANGSVQSEKEMGQTMEHAKNDVIGGVAEQQLMQGGTQSADKEQNDGHKQAKKSGNATVLRKMGTQTGNCILKEREKMQISHEKEAGKNDGPEVSQLQPNKRKWKRLIRELSKGGEEMEVQTRKRPRGKKLGQSPRKKTKLSSSNKLETKNLMHGSSTASLQLGWEPLMLEEVVVMEANNMEISAEAGGQPRRKP